MRLQPLPFVSLGLLAAIAGAALIVATDDGAEERIVAFEQAREEARVHVSRHPFLVVDAIGAQILDRGWFDEMRAGVEKVDRRLFNLPPRLEAESQAYLDERIEEARSARIAADPVWRLGVLDARTPTQNYLAHAFVHETLLALLLSGLVLLMAGAPLERSWGSPIYAAFVLAAVPMTALFHRFFDGTSGAPWSGGAGLSAAMLGAYFIRGLSGRFMIPGWVLLPVWLGVEAIVVRGASLTNLSAMPWPTVSAAVGLGVAAAGLLQLLGIEAKPVVSRARTALSPVVARAIRLRSEGDPYQAFDLIQAAWRDDPDDGELRRAFCDLAIEVDQPEVAADALAALIQERLHSGDLHRAVAYWSPIAAREQGLALRSSAYLQLAEGLIEAGQIEQAVFTLWQAVEAGPSVNLALRIVDLARDFDPHLTQSAVQAALAYRSIDPGIRANLEQIFEKAARSISMPLSEASEPSRTGDRLRDEAEHQPVETTAFPLDLDRDLEPAVAPVGAKDTVTDAAGLIAGLDSSELDALTDWDDPTEWTDPAELDVLTEWSDSADLGVLNEGPDSADPGVLNEGPDPAELDVLTEWSEPAELDALPDWDEPADLGAPTPWDEPADLSAPTPWDEPADLGAPLEETDDWAARPGALDSKPDEASRSGAAGAMLDEGDSASWIGEQDLEMPTLGRSLQGTTVVQQPARETSIASVEPGPQPVEDVASLRSLKAVEAIPLFATPKWVAIDAPGRGKSKLHMARLEAISIAAIGDLGPRPVLVIDLILNWRDDGKPLKLLRVRSDRFDPRIVAPGQTTALDALVEWLAQLASESRATCLPGREILEGRFGRYASLADYEREVLRARTHG
jgi:membrane associated rhomboid family serine protease